MYVKHVRARNFGPFEDFSQSLGRGLIGIFGPNGAGKSTLVDGVYANLTNDWSRFDGPKADRIRDVAGDKEPSFFEIEAEHEGTEFTLRRSLRPSKSSLRIDGEELTKANEIEAKLRNDLGVDPKIIDRYVFVGQWQMFDFLSHTPKQRAEAFRHLCRTEEAETLHDVLGDVISDNRPSADYQDDSDELLTSIGRVERELEELSAKRAEHENGRLNAKSRSSARKIVGKREKYTASAEALEEAREEEARLAQAIQDADERVAEASEAVREGERRAEELAGPAESAAAAMKAWERYEKHRKRREKLRGRIEELQRKRDEDEEPGQPEDYIEPVDVDAEKERLAGLRSELKTAESICETYDESQTGECPTCHQAIDEEFVEEQRARIEPLGEAIEEVSGRIIASEAFVTDWAEWNNSQELWGMQQSGLEEQLSQLDDEDEPDGSYEDLKGVVEQHRLAKSDLALLRAEHVEAKEERAGLQGEWTANNVQIQKHEVLCDENRVTDKTHDRAKRRLDEDRAAELAVERIDGQVEELTERLAADKKSLDRIRAVLRRRKKLTKAIKVLDEVRDVFHWNNLPRLVAQGNLVNMEQNVNTGLEWFGSPFWVESDEELGFQVHFPGRPPHRAEGLSGGQKGVFAIAFRCAIGSLFDADTGMMVLDEPTVGLDERNLNYFGEALEKLASEVRGTRQIIVITHHAELRPAFDQVLEIGAE